MCLFFCRLPSKDFRVHRTSWPESPGICSSSPMTLIRKEGEGTRNGLDGWMDHTDGYIFLIVVLSFTFHRQQFQAACNSLFKWFNGGMFLRLSRCIFIQCNKRHDMSWKGSVDYIHTGSTRIALLSLRVNENKRTETECSALKVHLCWIEMIWYLTYCKEKAETVKSHRNAEQLFSILKI